MQQKRANRWPYWSGRVAQGNESGDAAATTQWDLARTYIRQIPIADQRDRQWRSLAVSITAYTSRFTAQSAAGTLSDTTGRNADTTRTLRASVLAVERASTEFDTARKFIRRVDDPEQQENHWRDLEHVLRTFNERFDKDPTRAIARMATRPT